LNPNAALASLLVLVLANGLAFGAEAPLVGPPSLEAAVADETLPPLAERLPERPLVVDPQVRGRALGRHGGDLHLLTGRTKDVRLMVVYGYARLVGYNEDYELVPDILEAVEVQDDRVFTLRLRPGHRWSDGEPFTAEDFRYFWEDIAHDLELSPFGLEAPLLVDGEEPTFEVIDEHTVRYVWKRPNPYFLPALAGARPLQIMAPAHYLERFHARYADPKALAAKVEASGSQNWASLHHRMDSPYKNDNPERPSLQPWVNTTLGPAQRFVFARNPYFHRVDAAGRQLPYIDRVVMTIVDGNLIPAKTGAGETDLQARHLGFNDYTFLKAGEERSGYDVRLWDTTKGAHIALFPNLNASDPVWREVLRDARFRRALSLAINRHEINQVLYYGLAREGNNTVHPDCPFYEPEFRAQWAEFDPERANRLLDEMGLGERDGEGVRLLPDGRPAVIVVETAGEDTEQVDVLELIHDTWQKIGIKLFSKPLQREVLRNRVFSGETLMSVWGGLENGLPTASTSPRELAPTEQVQLQWPKWGVWYESSGQTGEAPDLPAARELLELLEAWEKAPDAAARTEAWKGMLAIHANQVFTIGIVAGVPQPVVVSRDLRNVPEKGIYNWDPGAHFGVYRPDTFWFERR